MSKCRLSVDERSFALDYAVQFGTIGASEAADLRSDFAQLEADLAAAEQRAADAQLLAGDGDRDAGEVAAGRHDRPRESRRAVNGSPVVHLMSSLTQHEEQIIVCNPLGLEALRRLVTTLEAQTAFVNDGEGYDLVLVVGDDPDKFPRPYTVDYVEDMDKERWAWMWSAVTTQVLAKRGRDDAERLAEPQTARRALGVAEPDAASEQLSAKVPSVTQRWQAHVVGKIRGKMALDDCAEPDATGQA